MFNSIIITDDSKTARMIIRRCLKIAGYHESSFMEANDGQEALEIAKKEQVDLMVIDLNMPNMDGRSLLKRVKGSPKLNHIPVLVISSLVSEAKAKELKDLGAFATLSKPVSPADLAKVLQEVATEDTWGM